MQNKILVVEDDADISAMLLSLLDANSLQGHAAFSGSEALLLLERERYSCLLLDLMLPGTSGLEVLRHLRANGDMTPVIVLTAVADKGTVADLLIAGANDYLTKPFDTRELIARIEVQLRKSGGHNQMNASDDAQSQNNAGEAEGGALGAATAAVTTATLPANQTPSASTTSHKNLTCDPTIYDALVDGQPAHLSKTEFALFQLLMSNPQRVFTKDVIYAQVWGGEFLGDNTINVHISKLRAKLAALDPDTEHMPPSGVSASRWRSNAGVIPEQCQCSGLLAPYGVKNPRRLQRSL
jgi:DNA-binding response OmpR family regulator